MKSPVKRTKIDNLIFQWNHKIASDPGIKKNTNNKQCSIEEYLDFLTEIKPYKQELYDTKIFGILFTLP